MVRKRSHILKQTCRMMRCPVDYFDWKRLLDSVCKDEVWNLIFLYWFLPFYKLSLRSWLIGFLNCRKQKYVINEKLCIWWQDIIEIIDIDLEKKWSWNRNLGVTSAEAPVRAQEEHPSKMHDVVSTSVRRRWRRIDVFQTL